MIQNNPITRLSLKTWLQSSVLAVYILLIGVGTAARAQSSTATLTGTVLDANEASVPEAIVTVISTETKLRRQVASDREGRFVVALLPPDRYSVTVERQGFAMMQIKDLILNVNDERAIRVNLKVGQISESVTVEGSTLIQTESAAVSTLIDRQFVANLPLNGRSFSTLIELTPGTALTPASQNEPGQFSSNGQRSNANYFTIDGVSANFGVLAGSLTETAGGTVPALNVVGGTSNLVSIDALQEFRIQTSSYAPEFGRLPGAQISIITRSGTNQFHGTVFDYFRNDALDANDWFANSQRLRKPEMRQNDFGGVFGGPIQRNRTFFFFSYEGSRLRQPQVAITEVPTLQARQTAAAPVKPLLNAFPLPTGADLGNGLAVASASYSNPTTLNASSIRVDHTFSDKITLFGRLNYAPSMNSRRLPDALNNLSVSQFSTQTVTVGSTQSLTARMSNDLRLNFSRSQAASSFTLDKFGGGTPPPDSVLFLPFMMRQNSYMAFIVAPIQFLVGGDNATDTQRQWNVIDNFLFFTGNHQLKFGVDYRRLNPTLNVGDFELDVFYADVPSAVANTPGSVSINTLPSHSLLSKNFSVYAQDTWRAKRRLTLTYGLRWDLNPPPSETHGNDPYTIIGLENPATMTLAPKGTPLYKTRYNNFAPRIGAAYQLWRPPGRETVLRGGLGIFYDLGTGPAGHTVDFNLFPYSRVTALPTKFPIDPAQVMLAPISLAPPYGMLSVYDPNFLTPRTYQWNVAVERALGRSQALTASYVGALGRRLIRMEVLRGPSLSNPNFTRVAVYRNSATSDYHAMQVQFQRRLSRGLQVLASYTWSHSIDISSFESSRTVSLLKIDPKTDRGSSNFDVRHSFTTGVTYDLPKLSGSGLAQNIVGHWSIDAIVRARTATPVDIIANTPALFGVNGVTRADLIGGVPLYLKDSMVAGGRRINAAAFAKPPSGRQGTLGRNVLRGFPLSQVDLSLRRQFALTEQLHLQLRADFFNAFNHPNFGRPDTLLGDPLFGQSLQMLGRDLGTGTDGSFSPLYQIGGPRSIQLAAKLQF